ncbi:divalent-cation tolerance protein CutA [Halocatena marina]|uniref:Divalent-cation tolerance protein CutA n=1 Tax=Halocatena marina TaxID=2934937 RepID=A0ABD5YLM7_9EURY|nr:divalent-cation tolerance protein CutA [Halocatena marina]
MPTAYITAPPDSATDLARMLVDKRLAACVNRIDCQSIYRWEGEIANEEEVILLAKTTDERYDDLVEQVTKAHPHDVPCIERFDDVPIESFAAWRDASVA